MTGFQGMDTAQVEDFSGLCADRSGSMDDRFSTLEGMVRSIIGSGWVGSDADSFGDRFSSEVMSRVEQAIETLRRYRDELLEQVEEQNSASEVDGGGLLEGILGTLGDAFDAAADFLGEVWGNFTDNLLPNIGSLAGLGVTALGDLAGGAIEAFAKGGFRVLGSAVPFLGDAFTGVMAGIERWNQDSHLPFGERLGRSLLDGGANLAGSLLGGLAGSAIGGAAGAPAAGIGAIFGAIGGGSVGAGVGIVVGDMAGSYVGGAAGDAIFD